MRSLIKLSTALAAAAVVAGAGCVIIDDEPDLRITELMVTGENDWGLLDVEVHLFDAFTYDHLGCSGRAEGLERVDANDTMYHLDAWFRDPYTGDEVRPWVLNGREVEVQVVEDDEVACPAPPGLEDDMIGISPPIDRAMVDRGPMLSFGRATVRLAIE